MNQQERDALVQKMGKDWIDKGMLIEAGFAAFASVCVPAGAPPEQAIAMRLAFFAGAQHLWGTINNVLDPDKEPTDADMRRMELIDRELRTFVTRLSQEFPHR